MNRRRTVIVGLAVFGVAFLLRMGVAAKMGLARPMESDSHYYIELAKSLAHGEGYRIRDSFWPDSPTMQRMPAWPFVVSLGLRACRHASPDLVMRVMCITLDSLNAVLVAWLAWRLLGRKGQTLDHRPWTLDKEGEMEGFPSVPPICHESRVHGPKSNVWALVAGALYAAHPAALFLVYTGEAEPLFVTLCLTGFLLLLRGGWWACAASLCFGLSCLVRASYVIWIGVYGCLVLGAWCVAKRKRGNTPHPNPLPQGETELAITVPPQGESARRRRSASDSGERNEDTCPAQNPLPLPSGERAGVRVFLSAVFCAVLFLTPPLLWTVRNYTVCGHFPVLSTLRGQTFYGGNNPLVANTWEVWGYWIFPDAIPGETRASELAKTMSEYDLDVHYFHRGVTYVKKEWSSMPRLLLGKFVRAFVPIPWKPNLMSYGVGFYRTVIYVLAIVGLCWWWRRSLATSGRIATTKDTKNTKGVEGGDVPPVSLPLPGGEKGGVRVVNGAASAVAAYRQFALWFVAMLLTGLAGVLIFWGCFRFAFVLEPVLIPFAAMGTAMLFREWRRPEQKE